MKNRCKRIGRGARLALTATACLAIQPVAGWAGPAEARALQEKALAELKASLAEAPDPAIETLVEDLEGRLRAEAAARPAEPPALPPAPPVSKDPEAQARAYVDWMLARMPPVGETGGFEVPREYQLEPRDAGYHVRLDPVILHVDEAQARIGPMEVQANPLADGTVRVRLTLNPHMTFTEGGKVVAELTLGRQAFDSLWDPRIQTFTRLDWNLAEVTLHDLEGGGRARLDSLTLHGATRYAPKGPWRQDLEVQGKWLRIDNPEAKTPTPVVRLDGASLEFSARGRDLEEIGQISKRLETLSQSKDAESPETTEKILAEFKALLRRFDAYALDMEFTGLDVEDPDTGQSQLGRLYLAQALTSEDDKPGTFRIQFEMEGLKSGTQAPLPLDLTPTAMNLDLALVNLPPHFGEWLADLGRQAVSSDDPQVEARIQQQVLGRLMQSGVGLVMRDTRIAFPHASLKLDLDVRVDPQAALQSVGQLAFEAVDLDRLTQAARALGGGQDADQVLALFSALAERHKEGDRVIDRLQARVDAKGRIWVNGKDVTALFIPEKKGAKPVPGPSGGPPAEAKKAEKG